MHISLNYKWIFSPSIIYNEEYIIQYNISYSIGWAFSNTVNYWTKTKRIQREIKDREEIEVINREIVKNLSKLNKNYNIVDYNKPYAIGYNKIYNSNGVIYKKKMENKKLMKIPVNL